MEIGKAYTDALIVGDRLRQADMAKVESLAESMDAIGLQQPISVWIEDDAHVHLVAGLHRFLAAKALRWSEIPAIFVEMDDIDRQLWEIDENLIRSELTPTQEAEHLNRRAKLFADRQSRQLGAIESKRDDGKGHRREGFASDTARKTGKSKRDIQRAVKRAEEVTSEARDVVRNTALDTGAYLDKLLKVPEDQQADRARDDLKALHDKLEMQRRRDEATAREAEAKEARKRAAEAFCELLCDRLPAKDWDAAIRHADDAGWTGPAKALRAWMAPGQDVAA